ncbi:MAG: DUF4331 domain-containing protein [Rhizobiaceae bacterium]|nr:DUF4331 domain-containing protein [Rhizobiaceae bacterium]
MNYRATRQVGGTLLTALLASTTFTMASSHREAPGITEERKIDGTDLYMFRSYEPGREDFVTFIANYQPDQGPYNGPNYFTMDPDAIYEIHVDNTGDAVEDLTFQFDFDNNLVDGTGIVLTVGDKQVPIALRAVGPIDSPNDPDQGETESFSLNLVTGDRRSGTIAPITNASGGSSTFAKPIDNVGTKTIADYPGYAQQFIYDVTIPGCGTAGRAFVGQRAEAFAVNLGKAFDLVNFVPVEGDSAPGANDGGGFPGGITQSRDNDDLVDKANITSLALEVPIACLVGAGNGVIGAWTTASLPQAQLKDPSPTYEQTALYGGAYVQRSRLSAPLVNELVIGLKDKDLFNAAEPTIDAALLDYVSHPTFPAILNVLFRDAVNATLGTNIADLAPTNFPRNDLITTFLTGFPGVNQLATLTPSEMMRLNTAIAATPRESQSSFGVVAADLAGYPNGRRPADDTVDITLRVAMGRLCHPIDGVAPNGLGLCTPDQASTGLVAYTDGAPISAIELQNAFPYLNDPLPGSGGNQ